MGAGVPCRCPRSCGTHRRSGPQPAWDTRPGLLSHQRLLKPPQGPASPAPQGPQSWESRPAGPSCGKLRALQLVRGRQGGWVVSTSLPRSGPGPLIPSFSSRRGGRSRPASHGSLTLLPRVVVLGILPAHLYQCGHLWSALPCSPWSQPPPRHKYSLVDTFRTCSQLRTPGTGSFHSNGLQSQPGHPCFLGKEEVQVGPWTRLCLPQSMLWGQSYEHSWREVGGGCGSGFWAWTPWAHLPPASSQLLLVAPPARPASARTQAPCALDCPSHKPALPILSLTWQSPITQPALRQSCSGSRGPGKRTYLHRGPFLGCREDRRGSRSVVSTGAGRKQISMGLPGPWNLSVWPVPREGGVWLLAGAREQGWNKPRCPSQVMVSSP